MSETREGRRSAKRTRQAVIGSHAREKQESALKTRTPVSTLAQIEHRMHEINKRLERLRTRVRQNRRELDSYSHGELLRTRDGNGLFRTQDGDDLLRKRIHA